MDVNGNTKAMEFWTLADVFRHFQEEGIVPKGSPNKGATYRRVKTAVEWAEKQGHIRVFTRRGGHLRLYWPKDIEKSDQLRRRYEELTGVPRMAITPKGMSARAVRKQLGLSDHELRRLLAEGWPGFEVIQKGGRVGHTNIPWIISPTSPAFHGMEIPASIQVSSAQRSSHLPAIEALGEELRILKEMICDLYMALTGSRWAVHAVVSAETVETPLEDASEAKPPALSALSEVLCKAEEKVGKNASVTELTEATLEVLRNDKALNERLCVEELGRIR